MACHFSYDKDLIGEMVAGIRVHYKGMFAFGIDHTVVNVTKDRVWIREAAWPESSNSARPNPQWLLKDQFDGKLPESFRLEPGRLPEIRSRRFAIWRSSRANTHRRISCEEVRELPKDLSPMKLLGGFGRLGGPGGPGAAGRARCGK
jgi:hypothetical protein